MKTFLNDIKNVHIIRIWTKYEPDYYENRFDKLLFIIVGYSNTSTITPNTHYIDAGFYRLSKPTNTLSKLLFFVKGKCSCSLKCEHSLIKQILNKLFLQKTGCMNIADKVFKYLY